MVSAKALRRVVRTTAQAFVDGWTQCTRASQLAGVMGLNMHVANGLAAIYLATGQDVACVVENSLGLVNYEVQNGGDLYATLSMPSICVGTVGGGTRLAAQRRNLELLGCTGDGSSKRLAEIVCAAVLALELSLGGAIASNEFALAHGSTGGSTWPGCSRPSAGWCYGSTVRCMSSGRNTSRTGPSSCAATTRVTWTWSPSCWRAGGPFSEFAMVAAQDYFFGNRLQSAANLLFNLIPLERRATQRQLMAHIEACKRFLDGGRQALIIFPEGTRTPTGEMQAFKRGPAVVSTTLGLPLVPAYIDGTYRAWRKNNWFMRPRHIRVRFGQPVEPMATNESETPFATYRRITEELERRVHELRERTRHDRGSDPHEMVGLGRRADGV